MFKTSSIIDTQFYYAAKIMILGEKRILVLVEDGFQRKKQYVKEQAGLQLMKKSLHKCTACFARVIAV